MERKKYIDTADLEGRIIRFRSTGVGAGADADALELLDGLEGRGVGEEALVVPRVDVYERRCGDRYGEEVRLTSAGSLASASASE